MKKEPREKGAIVTTVILILLMIIIILGAFALFVKFDVAGFGSKIMRPILKDAPVVKMILPDEIEEPNNTSPYKTLDEAVFDIKKLQLEIDKLKKENADNKSKVEDLTKENAKLKKLEMSQEEIEAKIKAYENEVVFGENALDITQYQKYYEQIDPERAEELYKQVIYKVSAKEKAKELANTYAKMDPGAAAAALEELDDNIALVCDVLLDMTEKNRAAIMDEMSAPFAAKVTKRIYSQTKE